MDETIKFVKASMKNILFIILLYPILVKSQGATVDSAGNLVGYSKTSTVDTGRTNIYSYFSTKAPLITPSFTTGFTIGGVAGSRKIPIGNGTNYVASTETYAVPGTSGNALISDGTNWAALNTRTNWTTFVVSGSDATTTSTTLVDITGLVSGALAASTKYEVECWLDVGTSAVTTGTGYGLQTNGTGAVGLVVALIMGTSTTNAMIEVTQSAPGAAQAGFLTTSSASGVIYIHGFVTTRSTGTITISCQHLKTTSGTSTSRVGSKMSIRLAN